MRRIIRGQDDSDLESSGIHAPRDQLAHDRLRAAAGERIGLPLVRERTTSYLEAEHFRIRAHGRCHGFDDRPLGTRNSRAVAREVDRHRERDELA